MKSQYPQDRINCQTSEPSDYLLTYSGLRQISEENLKMLKASYKRVRRKRVSKPSITLGNPEEAGFGSIFYNQTFRLDDDE